MAHTGKATASVNGTVVAETASWEEVDGNVYFPPGALREGFWTQTEHTTHCPWKGDARYYTITVDGMALENAAWFYPETKEAANNIKDHVAFYKNKVDVKVE
jgi:uncharacterized protein (DUF427 family)